MQELTPDATPYEEQLICAMARVYPRTWKNYRAGRSRHITSERIEKALLELQLGRLIRRKAAGPRSADGEGPR
jgi:hypothetical protein